jgi:PPIC-type PPIASE domain/MmeI, target recognition domain
MDVRRHHRGGLLIALISNTLYPLSIGWGGGERYVESSKSNFQIRRNLMNAMKQVRAIPPIAIVAAAMTCAPAARTEQGTVVGMRAAGPIVARGKGFEIRRGSVDEAWEIYAAKMARGDKLPNEPRDAVEARLLSHIIDTEILLRKATDDERTAGEATAGRTLADSRKRFASNEDFASWIKAMGMSLEQYRVRITEQQICELVIDREIKPRIKLSDDAVKKYYEENAAAFDRPEQVRARQILFLTVDPATREPLPAGKKAEKRKLAQQVKTRLDKGEDFFQLCKEFSDEPWAKNEISGDEPLYVKGQMPPEFDEAAFSLEPRSVSGVVESPLGYHIIRVSEKQAATRLPLADVAPRLREFLIEEEVKKQLPDGTPERFIIDFQRRTVLEAQNFPAALAHVKDTVLPDRLAKAEAGKDADGNARTHHKGFLERWWALSWDRKEMFANFNELQGRFIACSRVTKRPVFVFLTTTIWPSDKIQAFLFDDDYSFGVFQSSAHWHWFTAKGSKLTERFSYSIESVFDTFAWPQAATMKQIDTVAIAAREVRRIRAEALRNLKGGLRALYRTLELPGANPLKDVHAALDAAVLAPYGFSAKKDLLAQLLALNLEVAAKIEKGEPVIAPGIPKNYPEPKNLVTEDCIKPSPL